MPNAKVRRSMKESERAKDIKGLNRAVMSLLFFANWFFVVELSKKFMDPPHGNIDFIMKNLGSFFASTILTGIMLHFSSRKAVAFLIPIIAVLALAIAFG
jgi:hypothetical protein